MLIEKQEIVFLGDGAAWIWNIADEDCPNAVEIVEDMHAKSHLSDVAKHALGETQTDVIDAWIKETAPLLFDGNRTEMVARMCALEKQNPEVSEILEREARYFAKHKKRMQSKTFREKGYQIGRGVIESACPLVVAERCPQAGPRWEKPGINAVLGWNSY